MANDGTIDRELSLEGSINFRDLGGLQTTDGRSGPVVRFAATPSTG